MGKPTARDIRSAEPLYRRDLAVDPILVCDVCGQPSADLHAYQAHDDHDNPGARGRRPGRPRAPPGLTPASGLAQTSKP